MDAVETLAMETEGLFKQNPVLHRPLVWKRSEVREVSQGLLHIVLVPEEHAQGLEGETGEETKQEETGGQERERDKSGPCQTSARRAYQDLESKTGRERVRRVVKREKESDRQTEGKGCSQKREKGSKEERHVVSK